MTITLSELKVVVARELKDPDNKTFTDADLGDFIDNALTEIGEIAPERFRDDIVPIADTVDYPLRAEAFPDGNPDIEVRRVEIFDGSTTPPKFIAPLQKAATQRTGRSDSGWELWDGVLTITDGTMRALDPDKHVIRVTGYSPYVLPVDPDDVVNLQGALLMGLREYCRVQALQRLNASRELYSQWQTRSGNSDISPAGLLNALSLAQEAWRRRSMRIGRLRES